jgi:hypothetical protein
MRSAQRSHSWIVVAGAISATVIVAIIAWRAFPLAWFYVDDGG